MSFDLFVRALLFLLLYYYIIYPFYDRSELGEAL